MAVLSIKAPSVPTVQDNGQTDISDPLSVASTNPALADFLQSGSTATTEPTLESGLETSKQLFQEATDAPLVPAEITSGETFDTTIRTIMEDVFGSQVLANPNPLRQPGRAGYDPATDGIPTVYEEAIAAQLWLLENSSIIKELRVVQDPITGDQTFVDLITGERATAEQIAAYNNYQLIEAESLRIVDEDLQFRIAQGGASIDAGISQLESQLAQERQLALQQAEARSALEAQRIAGEQAIALQKQKAVDDLAAINLEYDRRLQAIQEEGLEARFTAELQNRLDIGLATRRGEIQNALQNSLFNFQEQQAQLDRHLQALELEEATRAAQQLEFLRGEELELQQKAFKLNVFTSLAQSPEILFFLGQNPGMLQSFGDLLGDGGQIISDVLTRLNERPTANIQQFRALTGSERGTEAFRITATTGTRDVSGLLAGEAPAPTSLNLDSAARIRLGRT